MPSCSGFGFGADFFGIIQAGENAHVVICERAKSRVQFDVNGK